MTLYHWKNRFASERLHYRSRIVTVVKQKEWLVLMAVMMAFEICN